MLLWYQATCLFATFGFTLASGVILPQLLLYMIQSLLRHYICFEFIIQVLWKLQPQKTITKTPLALSFALATFSFSLSTLSFSFLFDFPWPMTWLQVQKTHFVLSWINNSKVAKITKRDFYSVSLDGFYFHPTNWVSCIAVGLSRFSRSACPNQFHGSLHHTTMK